jgi:hypothetical protein
MAELKTGPNDRSVAEFLEDLADERRRADSIEVLGLIREVTGLEPRMWGDSIVGFGSYHYTYESGREGDWFLTGFSPRKQNLTVYIMSGFDQEPELMQRLGKHTTGKSCLYLKRLGDVDREVLKELVRRSVDHVRKTWP